MALNDRDLVWSVKVDFPMDEFDMKRWRERAEAAANTKLGQPKRTVLGKQRAVVAAAGMSFPAIGKLLGHSQPVTTPATRTLPRTRCVPHRT